MTNYSCILLFIFALTQFAFKMCHFLLKHPVYYFLLCREVDNKSNEIDQSWGESDKVDQAPASAEVK